VHRVLKLSPALWQLWLDRHIGVIIIIIIIIIFFFNALGSKDPED